MLPSPILPVARSPIQFFQLFLPLQRLHHALEKLLVLLVLGRRQAHERQRTRHVAPVLRRDVERQGPGQQVRVDDRPRGHGAPAVVGDFHVPPHFFRKLAIYELVRHHAHFQELGRTQGTHLRAVQWVRLGRQLLLRLRKDRLHSQGAVDRLILLDKLDINLARTRHPAHRDHARRPIAEGSQTPRLRHLQAQRKFPPPQLLLRAGKQLLGGRQRLGRRKRRLLRLLARLGRLGRFLVVTRPPPEQPPP